MTAYEMRSSDWSSDVCSSDLQDQVGVGDLLQRRAERLDQLVRQVTHEPDGVGHRVDPAVRGRGLAGGRVERREERVLDQHTGIGEPVQQRGLARVRVDRDRERRDLVALAVLALGVASPLHPLELAEELVDLGYEWTTIGPRIWSN